MIDPRESVIHRRLQGIMRILGFFSAKGGVGKTLCTTVAAVVLAEAGKKVAVLDLDMQGASSHLFLGVPLRLPAEDRGILPLPAAENLWLMSASMFAGERALALRGSEVSDAIRELFAVTQWGNLDFLFIDMPPGIGDELLDLARLVPRLEALVISTPSAVSVAVVRRLLEVLADLRVSVPGIVANMAEGRSDAVRDLARRSGVAFAGEVLVDRGIEAAIGDPKRLAATAAAVDLRDILIALGLL
jgi:ATP-binding protein involved in chromosome partitioning